MKPHIPIFLLSLSVFSCNKKPADIPETTPTPTEQTSAQTPEKEETLPDTNPLRPLTEGESDIDLALTKEFTDAESYMANLAKIISAAQEQQNADLLTKVLGGQALSAEQTAHIQKLISENNLEIDTDNPLVQIGEIKANKHARWAINLKGKAPIVLDVKRDASGNWKVDKINLPKESLAEGESPLPDAKTDALNYTHTFLNQLLKQDFKSAKGMVDKTNITDAKLAGLCILFEEADYKLDSKKPLRSLFMRDRAAGFYVNVVSQDGSKAAQFSVIAQRDKVGDEWKVYEINLDRLLSDYAKRVSGGDTFYTPLLKNPKGGDSLVIYFEFDSEGLTPRTQKQLNIVTRILRLDAKSTITVSGHTDAMGPSAYNVILSNQRAQAVSDYFTANGVSPEQVVLEAHGAQIPRQPNTMTDGTDNPTGRRANRRTEIYLDF